MERCQTLVPSMEIPTTTWFPSVTMGLFCHVSCSFSFRFTLDPIKSLPPAVVKTKSMGWGAPKVFHTDTILDQGPYQVDRLYYNRRTLCSSLLDSHNTAMAFNSKSS